MELERERETKNRERDGGKIEVLKAYVSAYSSHFVRLQERDSRRDRSSLMFLRLV